MPPPRRFAERLRQALALRGMTAADLSRAISVNDKTVGNWLRMNDDPAQTEPVVTNLLAICESLNVSADYLIGHKALVCGLTPGEFLVDLREVRSPTKDPDAGVAAEVSGEADVVSEKRANELVEEARGNWKSRGKKKGGNDAHPAD